MYFSQNPFEDLCSLDHYVQEYFRQYPECKEGMDHEFLYTFSMHLIDLAKSLLDSYDPTTGAFDSKHESFLTVIAGLPKTLLFYAFLNNSDLSNIDFNKVLNKTLSTMPYRSSLAEIIENLHDGDTRHIFNLLNKSSYPAINSSWTSDVLSNLSELRKDNQEDT